jgi:hypothetical protein
MPIQLAISGNVRPQPRQNPVLGSIEQTLMQGDSTGACIVRSLDV